MQVISHIEIRRPPVESAAGRPTLHQNVGNHECGHKSHEFLSRIPACAEDCVSRRNSEERSHMKELVALQSHQKPANPGKNSLWLYQSD